MSTRTLSRPRWAALATAVGCATLAVTAGCTPSTPQTLPSTAPPTSSETVGLSPSPTAVPATSKASPGCPDVGVYTVDGADSADVPKGLCLSVGARLRIENTFPNATADPPGLATCVYEAGIVVCLFTNPGNVTITWGQGAEQRSATILVVS